MQMVSDGSVGGALSVRIRVSDSGLGRNAECTGKLREPERSHQ
jgi:hypothetical protein